MTTRIWHVPVGDGQLGGVANDGAGVDLLFVPSMGTSAKCWLPVMSHLERFRSVAVDLPGHALSVDAPLPRRDQPWDFILTVIAELGLDRPVVVGHSISGFLALAAAADRPDLISSVVTLEAALMEGSRDEVSRMLEHVYNDQVIDVLAERFGFGQVLDSEQAVEAVISAAEGAAAKDWLLSTETGIAEAVRNSTVPRPDGTWLRTPDKTTMRAYFALDPDARFFPHTELYDHIAVPVHVVQSAEGLSVMQPDAVQRLRARRPNVQVFDIDGGHLAHYSHPVQFARIVRRAAEASAADRTA